MPHKAKFRPIQLKDGSAWYVLYSPDKGPTEHIEGFYTEEDALEWIELESTSWPAKKRDAIRKARRSPRPATSLGASLDDECNKLVVAIMRDSTKLAQKIEKVKYAQRSRSNGPGSKESCNRYQTGVEENRYTA
jgi:hypothetical protein